jgi:dihydropteroate synthase
MQLYKLSNNSDIKEICLNLNVTKTGAQIINNKARYNYIFIEKLNVIGANILKQEALSIGGELATPKNTITHEDLFVDCLLIVTNKQIEILSKKLLAQPFKLKKIAKELNLLTSKKIFKQEIMGILNVTPDSFYENSRVTEKTIIENINKIIKDGADYIDIGAQSTRPNAIQVGFDEENKRLKNIFKIINKQKLYENISFSIDSYHPEVMKNALDSGFNIINDITGLENTKTCKLAYSYKAKVIIMHMQKNPTIMQNNPNYDNVILEVDSFFEQRIKKAKSFNIEDIVLDIGIGFGKTLNHNLELIKHLEHFTRFNYPLLVGASRKSLINDMHKSETKDRLVGTISIHQKCLDNKASILRCHDVSEHKQMIDIWRNIH